MKCVGINRQNEVIALQTTAPCWLIFSV